MATSGSWRIYGSVSGLPSGTRAVDVSIAAPTTAIDAATSQTFTAATFAAIVVPAGATAVLVIPPTGNVGTITLKGVTGDTGVLLNKTKPTVLALDTSPTLGLLCSATTVVQLIWM